MITRETITSKQRSKMKAMASTISPIAQIGKGGITDNLLKTLSDALEARELIKVTVLRTAPYTAREACDALCERVHAEPVQVIGSKFSIYRQARKDSKLRLEDL